MLKNYNHSTLTNTPATLVTVAAGHEVVVFGLRIVGAATASTLTLMINDGTSDVCAWAKALDAFDMLSDDGRIALPAGYLLKAEANADGVKIMASADDSEV